MRSGYRWASAVHLPAVSYPEYQDDEFTVLHVVDYSITTDPNTILAVAPLELDAALGVRVLSQSFDSGDESPGNRFIHFAKCFGC